MRLGELLKTSPNSSGGGSAADEPKSQERRTPPVGKGKFFFFLKYFVIVEVRVFLRIPKAWVRKQMRKRGLIFLRKDPSFSFQVPNRLECNVEARH